MICAGIVVLTLIGIALLTAAYKSRTSSINNTGLAGINIFEDFLNTTTGTAFKPYLGGTGLIAQGGQTNGTFGQDLSTILVLNTNAAADLAAMAVSADGITNSFRVVTGSATTMATYLGIETDPGSITYSLSFGLASAVDPTTADEASYFLYDKATSNNWIAVRTIGGVATQTVTNVPVAFDEINTFKIIVTTSRSIFYIGGTLVANVSTGGTSEQSLTPVYRLKQTSNGHTYVDIDYCWLIHQLPSPRPSP